MRTPPYTLHRPRSIDEAVELAAGIDAAGEAFDWISGGTDLLPNYKWHLNTKPHVISLAAVEQLSQLSETHIGAMVRLHDLAGSECTHHLIREAAGSIASVLIRRSGTVGGNICLDTRCFWFNQDEEWRRSIDWCLKCDCDTGADCRVISNQNELCVATYQADLAPALMALRATIHLCGPSGAREMPLEDFFAPDGITRNRLERGEFVTHLALPQDVMRWRGHYQKLSLRAAWDFPEAGVAAAWCSNGRGVPSELRIATTALETIPVLHSELVEKALAEGWGGKDSINSLAASLRGEVQPVNNTAYPPSYRRKMVEVLCQRALQPLLEESR